MQTNQAYTYCCRGRWDARLPGRGRQERDAGDAAMLRMPSPHRHAPKHTVTERAIKHTATFLFKELDVGFKTQSGKSGSSHSTVTIATTPVSSLSSGELREYAQHGKSGSLFYL